MKPLEMKFKVGDKVRSTLEGIEGEWEVRQVNTATRCYRIFQSKYAYEAWIHEKDLEPAPKYKVGDRVEFTLGGTTVLGTISDISGGFYQITCKFSRFESEIAPT